MASSQASTYDISLFRGDGEILRLLAGMALSRASPRQPHIHWDGLGDGPGLYASLISKSSCLQRSRPSALLVSLEVGSKLLRWLAISCEGTFCEYKLLNMLCGNAE